MWSTAPTGRHKAWPLHLTAQLEHFRIVAGSQFCPVESSCKLSEGGGRTRSFCGPADCPAQARDQFAGILVKTKPACLVSQEFGVAEAGGQDRKSTAVDGFQDSNPEELMPGSRNSDVRFQQKLPVSLLRREAEVNQVAGKPGLRLIKDCGLVTGAPTANGESKRKRFFLQVEKGREESVRVFVKFPAMIPENQRGQMGGSEGGLV